MKALNSIDELKSFLSTTSVALLYFSTLSCNVCKVLKPKLLEFIKENFPEIKTGFIDVEALPDLAAQNNIFTVPTITVLFDNKEFLRKSRNINLSELHAEIQRPYSLYF